MKYTTPEIEYRALMAQDVITASSEKEDDTVLPDIDI